MVLLKTKPGTGESKGFGFIKFADKEVEKKVRAAAKIFIKNCFLQSIINGGGIVWSCVSYSSNYVPECTVLVLLIYL